MSYLNANDITSNLAQGFDLTPYLEESDNEINDLAERLGVRDSDDIQTPLHFKIKRYGIEYVLTRLCEDKSGTNNPDSVEMDKYFALAEYHRRRANELQAMISVEMVTGDVNEIRDRAVRSGSIFRG